MKTQPAKTQVILEVEWEDIPGRGVSNGRFQEVFWKRKPSHVWTFLLPAGAPKPELPVYPVHNRNVFAEDYMHDWKWEDASREGPQEGGYLKYFTRIFDKRNVWILLEFEEKQ